MTKICRTASLPGGSPTIQPFIVGANVDVLTHHQNVDGWRMQWLELSGANTFIVADLLYCVGFQQNEAVPRGSSYILRPRRGCRLVHEVNMPALCSLKGLAPPCKREPLTTQTPIILQKWGVPMTYLPTLPLKGEVWNTFGLFALFGRILFS